MKISKKIYVYILKRLKFIFFKISHIFFSENKNYFYIFLFCLKQAVNICFINFYIWTYNYNKIICISDYLLNTCCYSLGC